MFIASVSTPAQINFRSEQSSGGGHRESARGANVVLSLSRGVWATGTYRSRNSSGIRALEKQWTVGQSRNDNRALDMIFDNALIYVEYGRLVTKGEYLARIKSIPPNWTRSA